MQMQKNGWKESWWGEDWSWDVVDVATDSATET